MISLDLHVHTTYSDGSDIREMVAAADDAGLDAIGLADHCILHEDRFRRCDRTDFDETYPERRSDIERLQSEFDVTILDGVEMNYDPAYHDEIQEFLARAQFDYTIGSVHYADEYHIAKTGWFASVDEPDRAAAVDHYVDWQLQLIESELFDIVGHLDLCERSSELRGRITDEQYDDLLEALGRSRSVPEINAGRVFDDYGAVHPNPRVIDRFLDSGVRFVLGSDAHKPTELTKRAEYLTDFTESRDLECLPFENGLSVDEALKAY
ncbi:histidinol-phosphatase HisJ family protein [Natrarchaeobius halalkaliphilus]|uniref:histidinol-phosphatase n=1 Tax=Natrarchaeobius halalkaliphilus TaxID=1679091 RepID=A0A3N6LL56_9EURY|nr:histidinol-phosphatase HisJ family protein [Natrarchaeobius halalkaliphilus]RQG87780.1 histidinol-phosphatase HisJ family protein [Natrarchaeobius halalkaliphilus]